MGGSKENYKGENKKDSDKIKLYFIQHVGALSSHLLQLQLSLSNEMTSTAMWTNQKIGVFCNGSR